MRITKTTGRRVSGCVAWPVRVTMVLVIVGVYVGGMLTPGVVQAAQCLNEAVRLQQGSGGLPECRGYELVSNFPKQGYPISLVLSKEAISAYLSEVAGNGERIGIGSNAAGRGVLGQGYDPITGSVMFARHNDGSGWSVESLNPPQSQFSDQALLASDANTGTSLWLLHTSDEGSLAGGLYARSSTGQFKLIGPEAPPPTGVPEPDSPTMNETLGHPNETDGVVGASREFTHVVLRANTSLGGRFLWPGDETFKASAKFVGTNVGSLYEYAGEEPVLVGVKGGLGNKELIGECGTTLGTLKGETTEAARKHVPHEISAEGKYVFFAPVAADIENESCPKKQPAVQELYARIDERETVDISEPSPSECDGEIKCEANSAIPADAEFEAASENGERVFFTSTQQLLPGATEDSVVSDSARVGCFATTEGEGGCNLYEYDFARPATERLRLMSVGSASGAEVQGVIGSSNDGSHVYFVAKGDLTGTEKNSAGKEAEEGRYNLYVYEPSPGNPNEPVVTFIASLAGEDAGSLWKAVSPVAEVTPDGDFLAFVSTEELTRDDESEEKPQLFEYDALTKTLVRASISEKGYGKNGNIEHESEGPVFDNAGGISNDGKTVVFDSKAALSPRANASKAGCTSVYEFSWAGSPSSAEGEVHLISDGNDTVLRNGQPCGAKGSTVAGEPAIVGGDPDIFFSTSDPLTWEDNDTAPDIYDARADGGTPAPVQAVGCTGSGCQQSPISPQTEKSGPLASELPRVGENLAPAQPPPPVVSPKTKPKTLTRAQKLAKALKLCKKKPKKKRSSCEKQARKLYGKKGK